MTILIIGTTMVSVLVLLVLYRNIPNKKIFCAFCSTLALAIGLCVFSLLTHEDSDAKATESALRHITSQQQIFDGWYTDYKKSLDQLDYNWQQFNSIVADFHDNNISSYTLYTRLSKLEYDANKANQTLDKLVPPISLDDGNYDLTTVLRQKTLDYAQAQYITILACKNLTEPGNFNAMTQEQQVRILEETIIRNAPDALFTATETMNLRENLTLPENS